MGGFDWAFFVFLCFVLLLVVGVGVLEVMCGGLGLFLSGICWLAVIAFY